GRRPCCCPSDELLDQVRLNTCRKPASAPLRNHMIQIAFPCYLGQPQKLLSAMNKFPNSIRIYLAAPLFNDTERSFNLRLAELISPVAEVFLPQRDGKLMRNLVSGGMPLPVARQTVFDADIAALKRSDCIIAVLDGRTIDEGVAFEIGYGRALNKLCLGLKTDDRALLSSGDNPMILGGCHEIYGSVIELINGLHSKLGSIDLSNRAS
uniref:nucleoside 2-deoxyribosyltransferase n=1 Tax=Ferrovibrio sp. TaxID=1917215 RepID=UPI0035B41AE6